MMQTETVSILLEETRQWTSLIGSVKQMREVQKYAK